MTDSTQAALLVAAAQIRNEHSDHANTAVRVGDLFIAFINSIYSAAGRFNVKAYGATGGNSIQDAAGFAAAATAALAFGGGTLYIPSGSYGDGTGWSFAIPSGIKVEGDGDSSILLNCHVTISGSAASAIPFTAPAAKGAVTISIPASALTGAWLRVSSVINCQSTDAGIDQLGDRAADKSFFAEFVQVKTGAVGTATLYRPTEFAYSNTPGPDSGAFTTSVARVVSFNANTRISKLKCLGIAPTQTEIVYMSWCRDVVFDDVTLDTNDSSAYAITTEYCLDCSLGGRFYGKRTSISLSQENPVHISSCTNVKLLGSTVFGGFQGVDVTYLVQDATYRGGPSIDCGADLCVAEGQDTDGYTSHGGCLRTLWSKCEFRGGSASCNGFRIRSRGDRVIGGTAMGVGSSGAGVKIHEAALFDSATDDNTVRGFSNGLEFDYAATTFATLRSLLGGSVAHAERNTVIAPTANCIALLDSPALATYIGPRIEYNELHNPGTHGVNVGAYINGAVVDRNRIYGIPATRAGVVYTSNIKRLTIGTNPTFNVNAAGFVVRGPSIATMMTDAATFPGGEAEALLLIGPQDTDAATVFTGIIRVAAAFRPPIVAGWQPQRAGVGATALALEMSSLSWYFSGAGTEILGRSLDASGAITRTYAPPLLAAGTPVATVAAPVGTSYVDSVTGIPYSKTSGGSTTAGWVKTSAT